MATLILSTVGTALGGPVGSAIGALIGQSIDQQLLAPVRHGPRLGDLNVQTSTYGTQIPRIYGTMRVAGTVIWSTDLIEHADAGGAKGQPDVTYRYTVSLAVALSSRGASSVRRIWADGKLLRGAAGDFKMPVTFRLHEGSENQAIDPLIGAIEGIESTPAYRGICVAVFEDLDLREFGNRIPFLTFELSADEDPTTIGSLLADVSGGAIQAEADQEVLGFAAYGPSVGNAIEPLVDCFGIQLFDDGITLRGPRSDVPQLAAEEEFGSSAEPGELPKVQREQVPGRTLPSVLRLSYYDPARDYQTGETRAAASEQPGKEEREELAAVLSAGAAKALAQEMLARTWAQRDKLTLRLPPKHVALEPGSRLNLPLQPTEWFVKAAKIEGFTVVADLSPCSGQSRSISADGGRIVANKDIVAVPPHLALLDVPNVLSGPSNQATILLAATQANPGWKRQSIEMSCGAFNAVVDTAGLKSTLGRAINTLAPAANYLIDAENAVEVELDDPDQWLTSSDDNGLAAGQNLAALGSELIQFGTAEPLGNRRFRLSRLVRSRGGTEWACFEHLPGETFCLLDASSLRAVALPAGCVGALVTATAANGATASADFRAEGLRPPSPVNLQATTQADGSIVFGWIRRSRLGFSWVDEVDAPLGESSEQYRITVAGSSASLEMTTLQPTVVIDALAATALGPGLATVEVRQLGDFAASRPAQLNINLS